MFLRYVNVFFVLVIIFFYLVFMILIVLGVNVVFFISDNGGIKRWVIVDCFVCFKMDEV